MDGVIANFEQGFLGAWIKRYPEYPRIELADRKDFKVDNDYPETLRDQVRLTYHAAGFYRNLPIIDGAREALLSLIATGHEVRICTAPLTRYDNCVGEKFEWVERHFGIAFTKRIIIAKDKTVVGGDYLIDDKPHITGYRERPEWTQVIFDAPYNRDAQGMRLHGWARLAELGL